MWVEWFLQFAVGLTWALFIAVTLGSLALLGQAMVCGALMVRSCVDARFRSELRSLAPTRPTLPIGSRPHAPRPPSLFVRRALRFAKPNGAPRQRAPRSVRPV